jgi:hypothetical protein
MAEATNAGNAGGSAQTPAGQKPPYKDNDGNEITRAGKFWAGIVIIILILWSLLYLIGHWPDRLPDPDTDEDKMALYKYEWFHVKLVDTIIDTTRLKRDTTAPVQPDIDLDQPDTTGRDGVNGPDTTDGDNGEPDETNAPAPDPASNANRFQIYYYGDPSDLLHLNTILLIMVAVAGFMGNMIYLAASFTTFVGAGKFKKSWVLWYCVKPFTAAALAVGIYCILRGGFLNMSDASASINLFGVVTMAILAGLFTDRATLKLKELFDVLLRPKEDRPHALDEDDDQPEDDAAGGTKAVVTNVTAQPLQVGVPATVTITGQNLQDPKVEVSIEDTVIQNVQRSADTITFTYTLPEAFQGREQLTVTVKNAEGGPFTLAIQQ